MSNPFPLPTAPAPATGQHSVPAPEYRGRLGRGSYPPPPRNLPTPASAAFLALCRQTTSPAVAHGDMRRQAIDPLHAYYGAIGRALAILAPNAVNGGSYA